MLLLSLLLGDDDNDEEHPCNNPVQVDDVDAETNNRFWSKILNRKLNIFFFVEGERGKRKNTYPRFKIKIRLFV